MKNQSTEDYIKSIYKLQKNGQVVTTSSLANLLGIGDGSVTEMLKKLSQRKLIDYTPYKGVSLTPDGNALALRMVRRHRLWEMFLVTHLGYQWDEIHDEAERLEHATSDELVERLDKLLGYPKVDPHGDPIPTAEGTMEADSSSVLTAWSPGTNLRVVRVSDAHPDILQHVTEIGLELNKKFSIKKKIEFDGSLLLRIDAREEFISSTLAENIFVEEV